MATLFFLETLTVCSAGGCGNPNSQAINLSGRNLFLHEILLLLGQETGYRVTINEGPWLKAKISEDIHAQNIEYAVESIVRKVGNPSHAVTIDKENKIIDIKILLGNESSNQEANQKLSYDPNMAGKSIHAEKRIEVVPPLSKGGKGMTLEEVEALSARRRDVNPDSLEVVPPMGASERGVRQEEIAVMQARIRLIQSARKAPLEVIPPK